MEMMRRTLLWASTNPWLSQRLPRRRFVRRAVRRFMPGETLDEALLEAAQLGTGGISTIVTMLGENVASAEETTRTVDEYVRALDLAQHRGLNLEVSIKPTHLGLDADPQLVFENASRLAAYARESGTLWIDMEGTAYTEPTLELYRALRAEHDNVGVCLQSYLRRTEDDLARLLEIGPRIRLVKGAYAEPPELAFAEKTEVDAAYLALGETLIEHMARGGDGFLGLGTHDPSMIAPLVERALAAGLGPDHFEVEMLYGIARRDQRALVEADTPLRVLISYGAAWFPWYMRRLAERPANVWFVLRSVVR